VFILEKIKEDWWLVLKIFIGVSIIIFLLFYFGLPKLEIMLQNAKLDAMMEQDIIKQDTLFDKIINEK